MANPLAVLRPAVYTALTAPPLVVGGAAVAVVAFGRPPGTSAYLLLNPDQDTSASANAARACRQWDCTLLVDAVTLQATAALSVALADALADAVCTRLDTAPLPLPAGWQAVRRLVETINGGSDFSGEVVDIHRYLRLRYTLIYTAPL